MRKLYYISFVLLMSVMLFSCKEKAPEITDAKDIEYDEFSTSRFPEFDANLEVSIYLKLPKTNGNEFLDSIYADLVAFYTDGSKREIQSGIEIFADSIESDYFANKEDIGDDISGYIYSVNYYDSIYPVFADGKLLVYYDDSYEYQGGAHGITGRTYSVYNIATGRRVTEDDIFVMNEDNEKALSGMIMEAFSEEYYDEKDDMWNEGISFLNGNFGINADALYYQYSSYEIGPYAMGTPVVALLKEDLKPFLKKDGPLYEYWFPEVNKK